MKTLIRNPVIRFLLTALFLYVAWYILYELWLHPKGRIDRYVIDNLIDISSFILRSLGYTLIAEQPWDQEIRTLGIDGTHGLWIGDPCNGLNLFALFAGFVIAYPGKLLNKLIFIPIGLVTIHLLNVVRIVALTLIVNYTPEYLQFNHTYTFTILVYSYVFVLWFLWAAKFSGK